MKWNENRDFILYLPPYPNNLHPLILSSKHCLVLTVHLFSDFCFCLYFFILFYLLFHFTWNQLHKLENHPLSYYLEPASTPGNYLTILSTLSSHYIHKFYSRLAIYVCQKLCILFILFALYYSSIFHKFVYKCLIQNLI